MTAGMNPSYRAPKTLPSRLHRAALQFILVFIGLGCGLGLAELGLRMAGVNYGGVFTMSSGQYSRLPGIFAPGQVVTAREIAQLPYTVLIDTLGYRGSDFSRVKPDGELRILYVGDSFVFGTFVENAESLPAQLERALADRCGRAIRVVNAGLGGSTITEHAQLIDRGLVVSPDLIILQFSENDVRDLAGIPVWDQLATNRQAKSTFPLSLVYPLARRTALWQMTLRSMAVIRSKRDGEAFERIGPNESPEPDRAYGPRDSLRAEYADRLMAVRDLLGQVGLPLVYAVYPSHLTVYDLREPDQLMWLDGVMEDLGIRAVSFLPSLVADGRPETELYLLPYDGHAAPEGYRIAAQALSDSLIGYGLLAPWCS